MADYVLGALLALLFVLAARSYFGRKFPRGADARGCAGACSGCPRAGGCGRKESVDKRAQ